MDLQVRNCGVIRNGEIKLEGITVLAGKNGTGKSTLGKILYCINRAFYNPEEKVRDEKARQLMMMLRSSLYREIGTLNTRFSVKDIIGMIINYENNGIIELPESIKKAVGSTNNTVELSQRITNTLEVQSLTVLTNIFDASLETELGTIVTPVNHPKRKVQITLGLDNGKKIQITKENQKSSIIKTKTALDKEIVFLDDPYIIDSLSDGMNGVFYINRYSHKAHLSEKLMYDVDKESIINQILGKNNREEFNTYLQNMCEGEIQMVSGTGYRFVSPLYRKPLSIENLSTGIKSILVLKTMIENGSMNNTGLLIVDEPEVHLHPEWQFQLARILVLLPRVMNVKVLMSTHSTDFLSAVNYYSKKYKMEDATYYYQTLKDNEYAEVVDVTNHLDQIYQDLSTPFLNIAEKI